MDSTNEVAASDFRDPPAFAPRGTAWYQIDDFVELFHAAKVAYYGNRGLFVHAWHRQEQGFEWYAATAVGYDNWARDAKSLAWNEPAPEGPDKRILSISDLIEFCRFTISQLLHEIILFEANISRQPELIRCIAATPVQRFQFFDSSKMLLEIYRICTNILPDDQVPVVPERRGAFELHCYLTRVLAESLNCVKPPPAVDDDRIPVEVDGVLRNDTTSAAPVQLPKWPKQKGWDFQPGEFAYNGKIGQLQGKPHAILKLLEQTNRPVIRRSIIESCWDHAEWELVSEETVRRHVGIARGALRVALGIGGEIDPIPSIESGANLGWKIDCDAKPKAKNGCPPP